MKFQFSRFLFYSIILLVIGMMNWRIAPVCKAQDNGTTSVKGKEMRMIWERNPAGRFPGAWDKTIKSLSDCGVNAVLPLMGNAGHASYASNVVPRDKGVDSNSDFLKEAIIAGKKYGVEVHVWEVAYKCNGASEEFINQMRLEGRLQKSLKGEDSTWLCPSDPRNVEYELRIFSELARNYELDGIQMDYIRYENANHCFCDGCKERFAQYLLQTSNLPLTNWPQCVRSDEKIKELWDTWRRDQVTNLVRQIHKAVKAIRPNIKLSAAVFACTEDTYIPVRYKRGQDWLLWSEEKLIDFATPMNYFNKCEDFQKVISEEKKLVNGVVPIYPGIGIYSSRSELSAPQAQEQIQAVRALNLGGFALYQLTDKTLSQVLPNARINK